MPHFDAAKRDAQARQGATAVPGILWRTLACRRPADRTLAAFLRDNRHCGARDRRLVSETLFAVLRWWGWLRHLAPPAFVEAIAAAASQPEPEPPPLPPQEWGRCLAGAHLLDGAELPPAALTWCAWAGVDPARCRSAATTQPIAERAALLAPLASPQPLPPLAPNGLLPPWSQREMLCPRPATELIDWLQRRPPVWLRAQTGDRGQLLRALAAAGLDPLPHPVLHDAVRLQQARINLRTLAAYTEGHFEVQDLASQAIGLVCAPSPGQRWWDACAGAGGKTLHLAQLMGRRGAVTASDIRTYKLEDLKARARRAGFPNIRLREWKGKALPQDRAGFDGVLVDAPCSCSGTWRRNPDGRWTTEPGELTEFVALQEQLLHNAAPAVRPGGVLVYATCSMFVRENLGVVHGFLAANPDCALDPFPHPLTGALTDGTLTIWPWDGDCDAMFAARFVRGGRRSGPA